MPWMVRGKLEEVEEIHFKEEEEEIPECVVSVIELITQLKHATRNMVTLLIRAEEVEILLQMLTLWIVKMLNLKEALLLGKMMKVE
jgi:hypothetical protein